MRLSLGTCSVASMSLGKDTPWAGVWGQDPGRRVGAGETPGLQEARGSSAQHHPPRPHKHTGFPVGHTEDRFSCSVVEGGGESSSCRNQEKQVF